MGKQSTVYKARLMKKMASFVISNIYKQVFVKLSNVSEIPNCCYIPML